MGWRRKPEQSLDEWGQNRQNSSPLLPQFPTCERLLTHFHKPKSNSTTLEAPPTPPRCAAKWQALPLGGQILSIGIAPTVGHRGPTSGRNSIRKPLAPHCCFLCCSAEPESPDRPNPSI